MSSSLKGSNRKTVEREISALLRTAPKTARLLDDGHEREVPVSELRPGQRVRVTANEQVPVDMLVESGESACDESMLTGEAEPIEKERGDTALAGTLNLQGVEPRMEELSRG